MRVKELLHNTFKQASLLIDKRLHHTLLLACETLLIFRQLSIVGIGRGLPTRAKVKHAIKRMDRLFGSTPLHGKIINYYQDLIKWVIKNTAQPIIIIDWSGLTSCGKFHFLRAAVPVGGRALPILDMAFPLSEYGSQKAHKKFVTQLKKILPKTCSPIVVTDAGFRCPWFKLITSLGWDFVGRVRHLTQYSLKENDIWSSVKDLYRYAQFRGQHLFSGILAKANPVRCEFYLVKQHKKNRVKKNLAGKKIQCSVSKKHEKRGNEPWLIVSSLSPHKFTANEVVGIYKKRMQIEESFRDLKNTKNGFGLRHSRTHVLERLNVLLLLGAIATWALWVLGMATKKKKEHWSFQTNSVRKKNILSNFSIGWQMVARYGPKCNAKLFFNSLAEIASCLATL